MLAFSLEGRSPSPPEKHSPQGEGDEGDLNAPSRVTLWLPAQNAIYSRLCLAGKVHTDPADDTNRLAARQHHLSGDGGRPVHDNLPNARLRRYLAQLERDRIAP